MKATKEQIIAEANRRRAEHGEGAPPVEHFIVDVVCENWTPPEPVDPDILAWRELAMTSEADDSMLAKSFVYGARMAREQERERAKVLVEYVEDQQFRFDPLRIAHRTLAKYRGEA